jgi:hypothetical protein
MHQEEAPTSLLGWHPREPLSRETQNIIKKMGKTIQEGGLGQDPRNKKRKQKQKEIKTTD